MKIVSWRGLKERNRESSSIGHAEYVKDKVSIQNLRVTKAGLLVLRMSKAKLELKMN